MKLESRLGNILIPLFGQPPLTVQFERLQTVLCEYKNHSFARLGKGVVLF